MKLFLNEIIIIRKGLKEGFSIRTVLLNYAYIAIKSSGNEKLTLETIRQLILPFEDVYSVEVLLFFCLEKNEYILGTI